MCRYSRWLCSLGYLSRAARLFGGNALSLGLILTFVVGATLFTANNQTVMAGCDGLIDTSAPLRDWGIV